MSVSDGAAVDAIEPRAPIRTIVHGDALAWLTENPAPAGASVVTSMPDVSDMRSGDLKSDLGRWRAWTVETARTLIRWVPEDCLAIFFQSDIRVDGALVDKGHLVMTAADQEGASVLFHKIVCRHALGTITFGRSGYSHLIAVTRGEVPKPRYPGVEVLPDAGHMPWSQAMGVAACQLTCRYLLENTSTRVVVDPFCGLGSVLAVANAMGLDAIGVDRSARRCRGARRLTIELG
jgi:hypothetical protein